MKIGDKDAFAESVQLFENADLKSLLLSWKESLKFRTIQYAKYQWKYIDKKIRNYVWNAPIFFEILLNDAKKYEEMALKKVEEFIDTKWRLMIEDGRVGLEEGNAAERMKTEVELEEGDRGFDNWKKYVWSIWDSKVINGDSSYQLHLKSKGHKAMKKKAAIALNQKLLAESSS